MIMTHKAWAKDTSLSYFAITEPLILRGGVMAKLSMICGLESQTRFGLSSVVEISGYLVPILRVVRLVNLPYSQLSLMNSCYALEAHV